MATEACSGGTPDLSSPWMFLGYMGLYRRKSLFLKLSNEAKEAFNSIVDSTVMIGTVKLIIFDTIDLLKKYGSVYLVRIPTAEYIRELEDSAFPDFDNQMIDIAEHFGIQYINCKNNSNLYKYTIDGNHFVTDDSYNFTNDLCDSIVKIRGC